MYYSKVSHGVVSIEGMKYEKNWSVMKDKPFNIIEINGTKPINEWLERGVENFAKREYGMNITVKVTEIIKSKPGE